MVDDEYASPHHATIYQKDDGTIWIRDEGSRNGTYLNNDWPVKRTWEAEIHPGDRIRIGRTVLTIPEF